jgi:hypothetical protein
MTIEPRLPMTSGCAAKDNPHLVDGGNRLWNIVDDPWAMFDGIVDTQADLRGRAGTSKRVTRSSPAGT